MTKSMQAEAVSAVTITSLRFRNFKALADFSVSLRSFNVLVGPNNAGKSTLLSAFRLLAVGLRRARSKNPEFLAGADGVQRRGYIVGAAGSSVSLENVHTDLGDDDSSITFKLSNGNSLQLYFPIDGGCQMFCDGPARTPVSTAAFKAEYPISVAHVPVLGPVEYKEPLLKAETVQSALETHRASRHFRNFWYHQGEGFEAFASLLSETWPGMEIQRPEAVWSSESTLAMYCLEERMTRELYWAGFGFQVWCQLLTHILRAAGSSIVVIDEPEIYLHPDLQRQLIHVLRSVGTDVILATHSTEILNEVEPADLLLVDKKRKKALRLSGAGDIQSAMAALGSNHNVQLAQLARHKRVLFVEGSDFGLLRRFARKTGMHELANGLGLAVVQLEGFSGWDKVRSVSWGFEQVLGAKIGLSVLLDRDFRCSEELDSLRAQLSSHVTFLHIHERKELENYLLCPMALRKATARVLAERRDRGSVGLPADVDVDDILSEITGESQEECRGQYQARRAEYLKGTRKDLATLNTETSRWFETKWRDPLARLTIVHGKRTLALLNERLQAICGVTVTPARIIDAMGSAEIAADLVSLLGKLNAFRGSAAELSA